jgi:ABC-type Fe3+-siderophore transport system permease subunit
MYQKINWDALGITTSVACAIHCAILPVVLSSLPVFGINIVHNQWFEFGMIILAAIIGLYALFHGYKKHHHKLSPLLIFLAGIICLIAKQYWHQFHWLFLVPAVVATILAHALNYRFCRIHNHAHAEDCNH